MKHMYAVLAAVLSAVALMGLGANSASATTLEVGGVPKNEPVATTFSLAPGTELVMKVTAGWLQNKCTTSHMQGTSTSPFSGPTLSVPLTTFTVAGCTYATTIDKAGMLEVEWISGTNGAVYSSETQVTFGTPIGTVNCKFSKTRIGTLTGAASGHAVLDVLAVASCGFAFPSLVLEGKYVVTSPTGLGVTA